MAVGKEGLCRQGYSILSAKPRAVGKAPFSCSGRSRNDAISVVILRSSSLGGGGAGSSSSRDDDGGRRLEDDRRLQRVVGRAGVLRHIHHRVLWGGGGGVTAVVVALHRPFGRAALLGAACTPVVTPAWIREI